MKIRINRADLRAVLDTLKPAVAKNSGLEMLRAVLLEADTESEVGIVQCTTTDLTYALQMQASAQVAERGAVAVSFERLTKLLGKLEEEWIELESGSDRKVYLREGGVRRDTVEDEPECSLVGIDAEEFPRVSFGADAAHPEAAMLTLTREALKEIRRAVIPAVNVDDYRSVLTGTQWTVKALWDDTRPRLYVSGVDGYRIAQLRVTEYEGVGLEQLNHLLPPRLIVGLDHGEVEDVTLWFYLDQEDGSAKQSGYVVGKAGGLWLRTALLEGQYPDVVDLIGRQAGAVRVKVGVAGLKYAMGLIGVYTDKLRLDVSPEAERLRVSALGDNEGKCVLPLHATLIEGLPLSGATEDFAFGLTLRYLMDALRGIRGDDVMFEMDGSYTPVRIVERNFRALIMPLNLNATEKVRTPAPAGGEGEVQPNDLRFMVVCMETGDELKLGFETIEGAQSWLDDQVERAARGEESELASEMQYFVMSYTSQAESLDEVVTPSDEPPVETVVETNAADEADAAGETDATESPVRFESEDEYVLESVG